MGSQSTGILPRGGLKGAKVADAENFADPLSF